MAPPDEEQLIGLSLGTGGLEAGDDARPVGHDHGVIEPDALVGGHEPPREHRLQRPEVEAVGVSLDLAQGQPLAMANSPGPDAQRDVHQTPREKPATCLVERLGPTRTHVGGVDARQESHEDLGVRSSVGRRLQHLGPPAHMVAHAHRREDDVEFLPLQRGRRRQDDIGMPIGLVDVVVDGHQEVQFGQRGVDAPAIGHGEHWVARDDHHGAHLPRTGGEDLVGERHGRELRGDLRDSPDPRSPAVIADEVGRLGSDHRQVEGRLGEHPAARFVQPARQDVEHVHEPVGTRAVDRLAHPEPRVHRCSARPREVAGQLPDDVGRHPGRLAHGLGREGRDHRLDGRKAVDIVERASGSRQALGNDHVGHGREQERVGARADEVVGIGDARCLRAARVDDHDPSASFANALEASLDVGRGHDRSVGYQRIAADDEQEVGAIDVGHRQQQRRAEEQITQQMLRLLVDAGRGVALARAQRLQQHGNEDDRPPAVRDRVAEIERDGVTAMSRSRLEQAVSDEVEGLIPADALPTRGSTSHGIAQAVRVVVQVLPGHALGAQVSPAHGIVAIPADAGHTIGLDGDLQAARRLAEIARAVVHAHDALGAGVGHPRST